jgi:hypothetical protein
LTTNCGFVRVERPDPRPGGKAASWIRERVERQRPGPAPWWSPVLELAKPLSARVHKKRSNTGATAERYEKTEMAERKEEFMHKSLQTQNREEGLNSDRNRWSPPVTRNVLKHIA